MRCKACNEIMKSHEFERKLDFAAEEFVCSVCKSAAFSPFIYVYDHTHIPDPGPDGPVPPLHTYG